jgi:uncharacterized membrane protein (GlpM family)
MKSQDILPVLASIVVIVLVAVLEKQSKLVAALTATMPIGATLALWIVYLANEGDLPTMQQFSLGLLLGILPSIAFVIAAWLAFRAGLKLGSVLALGLAVWGTGAALIVLLRKLIGF